MTDGVSEILDDEAREREWQEALSALHTPIYVAARATALDYPQMSIPQYADAGWRWALHHPKRILTAWDAGEGSLTRVVKAIRRHLEATGRREKAAAAGYRVEDEAFYPLTLIELALPAVWDLSLAQTAPAAPDENAGEGYLPPKRISDPAEGNNWLASVVDVRRAYYDTALSEDQVVWLGLVYRERFSVENVAHSTGLGPEYVSHQVDAALRKIQRTLGGERPTGCSASCECGGGF